MLRRIYGRLRVMLVFPNGVIIDEVVYRNSVVGRLALHGMNLLDRVVLWDAKRCGKA